MNTRAIFYPSVRICRALKESINEGLSRIEISYNALNQEAENEIFHPLFGQQTSQNLQKAFLAMNSVPGLGWHLPMKELMENFIQDARGH